MLVFKCKIKILIFIQFTYILYHFKANWIIKSKQTSLASISEMLHSTFEINISLAFQARLIFLSKLSCNILEILAIRSVLRLYCLRRPPSKVLTFHSGDLTFLLTKEPTEPNKEVSS